MVLTLLHITSPPQWQAAQLTGFYSADSLETEGFIHCSTLQQVVWVANQFYSGQSGLVLLCIDPQSIAPLLKYEAVDGVGTFPHVYGEIPVSAIVDVLEFEPESDGSFRLPTALEGDH